MTLLRRFIEKNEVLRWIEGAPEGNLCISRPRKRLAWGIEIPFDSDHVVYVWF